MTETVPRRQFYYAVEYSIRIRRRNTYEEEMKLFNDLLSNGLKYSRISADFVGVIDKFYFISRVRDCPIRLLDTMVREVPVSEWDQWSGMKVLRKLDECEEGYIQLTPEEKAKVETFLAFLGDDVIEHGLFKVRWSA